MSDPLDIFLEEAEELLEDIEKVALDLETTDNFIESINRLFRAFPTIKGSGAMFGFEEISNFTHSIEDSLDEIRNGLEIPRDELSSFTLAAKDYIRALMEESSGGAPCSKEDGAKILRIAGKWKGKTIEIETGTHSKKTTMVPPESLSLVKQVDPSVGNQEICIRLVPKPNIFSLESDLIGLIEQITKLGALKVTPELSCFTNLEDFETEACSLFFDLTLQTDLSEGEIRSYFTEYESLYTLEFRASHEKAPPPQSFESSASDIRSIIISLTPNPSFFGSNFDLVNLFEDLSELGELTVQVNQPRIPDLNTLNPHQSALSWDLQLVTKATDQEIKESFIFVDSFCKVEFQDDRRVKYEKKENIEIASAPVIINLEQKPESGQIDIGKLQSKKPLSELSTPDSSGPVKAKAPSKITTVMKTETSVKVASSRLDLLVNLVGELVVNQTRLNRIGLQIGDPDLNQSVGENERMIADLRDCVLSTRMMPIGPMFERYRRVIRDLCKDMGKKVDFRIEGGETELDKTVIDKLSEPMIHLIRNSMDHGISTPQERINNGKPETGNLTISATHVGAQVRISVEDDGQGLNSEVILRKAKERNLVPADVSLTDEQINDLIFAPGFSTADNVSNVSGRGVGMDAVRRDVERLRGSVHAQSRSGYGTTVVIYLPLTLAIIEGLLVEVADETFIIPMAAVLENVELNEDNSLPNRRNLIDIRKELVPFIRLRERFGFDPGEKKSEKVVVVNYGDRRLGLVVDKVLGNHQTVIQSLGGIMKGMKTISGATILGDGKVALILDLNGIVELANEEIVALRGKEVA